MSIYNQLKEKFIMKNAYEDWADYRKALTDIVIDNNYDSSLDTDSDKAKEKKSIAIIGAGRCNDLEVARLAECFDEITLIDVDKNALEECISSQEKSIRDIIKIRLLSINGLHEDDLEAFCDKLLSFVRNNVKALDETRYEKYICDLLDVLKEKASKAVDELDKKLLKESFDTVVCNGVFSQLLSMYLFFILSVSQSVSDEILIDVSKTCLTAKERLSEINSIVIPQINNVLISAAKKEVVFGNEFSDINKTEGSAQCIDDIRKKYKPEEVYLDWNFNSREMIGYKMLVQIIKKAR
ncbi:MAG: hypothetical protein IJT72_09085 [Lachnospiraceae bacterium]|nr:hypothetical protein [Lachnospiraceae bacterium]